MELVHRLRERGADRETIRAALEAVAPSFLALSDLMEGPPAQPAPARALAAAPVPITGNTGVEPTKRVSLEMKSMPKATLPRSLDPKGHIQWRKGTARVIIPETVLQADGSYERQRIAYPLGRVTPEEAERLREQIATRNVSKTPPTARTTVRDFIEQRYYPDVLSNLSLSSRKTYRSILGTHLIPAYGDMQLRQLTVAHLQRLCNDKRDQGLSVETLKHIRDYTSAVLEYAKELGVIAVNPARVVRLPRKQEKRTRITLDEVENGRLLAVVRDPLYSPLFEMVFSSCCTGSNYSEMAGLRIRRLNLTGEPTMADGKNLPPYSMAIRETYYRGGFGEPKNRGRKRIESLPDDLVGVLQTHLARRRFVNPDDLVFCDENGGPLNEHKIRRKLVAACKLAGIPRLGWNAFRRYFATQTDRKGMHPLDRQNSLGHASQEMTAHYTTADLERRRPYVEQIAKGLVKASSGEIGVTKPTPDKAK